MPKPTGTLKEMRELRTTSEEALAKVFEEAKSEDGNLDFTKVECLGKDVKGNSVAVAEKVRGMNSELNEIAKNIETLEAGDAAHQSHLKRNKANRTVPHPGTSEGGTTQPEQIKSFGQQVIEHDTFKEWRAGNKSSPIELPHFGLKTLFETSAGWAPESTRTGLLIEGRTRPIQVTDLIPAGQTGMAAIVYMEETTRTHIAAERAEGAAYAEDTLALTEQSSTVRSIGTSIPVTDEQLEDVEMVQAYLDQRLRFSCRQRLDSQLLTGDGNAPNLRGILNTGSIQTQAKGSDPTPDAIYKAMTLVRVTGRAMPNAVIFHPNDWQAIRLLRTADGVYIWGSPSDSGPERIWGLPIVQTDAETENTALVGDYANFCMLFERRGVEVKIGLDASDFTTGKQHMRASLRAAFVVFRPTAFCTVTGI
ncbi:MAG TPA: phage major capsid protein [Aurantimonas coralicida]|uniref:Phage major capsid protein n=1 Tax=Aurantimonas coralicida TaxID=182270 RepID=A0A9C9NGA8_9HYPH|nr:phage major capsid protein [Aurantimonas coralicida]